MAIIFDDPVALFDDPAYSFLGDFSVVQVPRKAAARIAEASAAGVLLQALQDADEVWVYERHEDQYVEIDVVDPAQMVLLAEPEKFIENSADFNYALFQTLRETTEEIESNADELVIYRGNWVKLTNPAKAPAVFLGYMVEVAPEDYQLTAVPSEATHGLIDPLGDGSWEIVPISELDGSVTLRRIGPDTYRGF